jgi:hypothetical protein
VLCSTFLHFDLTSSTTWPAAARSRAHMTQQGTAASECCLKSEALYNSRSSSCCGAARVKTLEPAFCCKRHACPQSLATCVTVACARGGLHSAVLCTCSHQASSDGLFLSLVMRDLRAEVHPACEFQRDCNCHSLLLLPPLLLLLLPAVATAALRLLWTLCPRRV